MTDPSRFFDRNGPLARVLPGYEERPAQRKLAQAVAGVLDASGLLLAEAGTGTGKTLAYLLPAAELGRRVVLSTGTKNLQEQLVQKDIPILAKALGRDLSVAVMKGRANYLCLLRFSSFAKAGSFRRLEEIPVYRAVEAWAPETTTAVSLARALGTVPSSLMSRFLRAGLPSPRIYLAHARLLHAAWLFSDRGLKITDIALRLEYSSPQSFGRHLRALLGVTASARERSAPESGSNSATRCGVPAAAGVVTTGVAGPAVGDSTESTSLARIDAMDAAGVVVVTGGWPACCRGPQAAATMAKASAARPPRHCTNRLMTKAHNVKIPGVLYVVATPIGNLDDISSRARAVLGSVAVIAAEDTRRARQLLDHLGAATPVVSFHEDNESRRVTEIIARLESGESVALISDAGTPLISDPGYRLVASARERRLAVTAIPGCCAAVAALSVSGLPTDRFHFEGFLPSRAAARRARLDALRGFTDTLVFYEAVHRVSECLADMAQVLGEDRQAFVARELTKLHDTFYAGTLAGIQVALASDPGADKGEFTLVVAGSPSTDARVEDLERVVNILAAELPTAQAAALASRLTGAARRDAYQLALRHRQPPED